MFNQEQVNVRRILFMETGTYNQMYYRPHTINMDDRFTQILNERRGQDGRLTPTSLAGVAGLIVSPRSYVSDRDRVAIDNGWNNKRLRFYMELETNDILTQTTSLKFLTGYTDRMELGPNNTISPSTQLMFNTVINIRRDQTMRGGVRQFAQAVTESTQVISLPNIRRNLPMSINPTDISTIRPADLTDNLQFGYMSSRVAAGRDFRSGFIGTPVKKSRRYNNVAGHYLANTLNAINSAANQAITEMDQTSPLNLRNGDPATFFGQASDTIRDPNLTSDDFFYMLKNRTNFVEQGSISWGDLMMLSPNADRNAKLLLRQQMSKVNNNADNRLSDMSGEYWTGANHNTRVATILSQAIPSMALGKMIRNITLRATNELATRAHDQGFRGTGVKVDVLNGSVAFLSDGLTPQFQQEMVNDFIEQLIREVLSDLGPQGSTFSIQTTISVLGDSFYTVSFNGSAPTEFATPTYADSLYSPIVTLTPTDVSKFAQDINTLAFPSF